MNQQLTVLIPEAVLALFLISAFIVLLAANVYDIRQIIQKKSLLRLQSKYRRAIKPTISIIIYAHNSVETIGGCLDSIRKNRYPKLDIVVVDNKSTDNTSGVIRSYIQRYPSLQVRLISKKQVGNRTDALVKGYEKSQKGELVMVLDASSIVGNTYFKDCAMRFWFDDNLQVLHSNVNNMNLESINLIYFRLRQLAGSLLNKSLSLVSRDRVNSGTSGSMYRNAAFKNAMKSNIVVGKYDSSFVVSDYSVPDDYTAISKQFTKGYSRVYFIIAVVTILLQTYSMYLAATFQSRMLLIIGWLAAALFVLLATWSSEALNAKEKTTLSLCAPFIYALIYLQLIAYIIFISVSVIMPLLKKIARSFVVGVMASEK